MDRVSHYRFYELGQRLAFLRTLDSAELVADHTIYLVEARRQLESLLNSSLGVKFSRNLIEGLVRELNELIPTYAGGSREEEELKLTLLGYNVASLNSSLDRLEAVLKAECDSLDSYIVAQKGAYSTPDLIEHAEKMIPEKTRNLLSPNVIKDVQEAGRCLAFDLPTASGFHMLRAIELVMLELLKHARASGEERPRNWGFYIDKFEKSGIPKKITAMLRDIKVLYRNPTAHPEDTLEEEEATTLFALGVSAIQQMAAQLPRASSSPPASQ